MRKPDSLRAWLTAAIPAFARDPERLQIYVDNGRLICTGAPGLSFEYRYRLNIILLDFAGSPDALSASLLAWVSRNQAELLESFDQNRQGIGFEVDVLDADTVDLSFELPLSERMKVTPRDGGGYDVDYLPEPVLEDGERPGGPRPAGATLTQLFADGELIAEWPAP